MCRFNVLCVVALCLLAVSVAHAGVIAQYDFTSKNTPNTSWQYEDVSGNGHHGDELGSFYNYNGDTHGAADMWEDAGGVRGGVYSYRWDYEVDYDAGPLTSPSVDGSIAANGSWDNNRLDLKSTLAMPDLAANAGLTFALWVNPQNVTFDGAARPHYGERSSPDADFSHLVMLGDYGDNPMMSIELDAGRRVHGWVEGDGTDTQVEVIGTGVVAANVWSHVAISYDRVNNTAKTYINGVLDSTTDITSVGDGELSWALASIGGGKTSTSTDVTFMGQMDDVTIYDEVLDANDIADMIGIRIVNITPTTLQIDEGLSDSYDISLPQDPNQEIQISIIPEDANLSMTSGATVGTPGETITITFNTGNWQTPQTVSVTAVDNAAPGGDVIRTVSHSVNVSGYNPISDVKITIIEDDLGCGDWGYNAMDFNEDCYVNLEDFVLLALQWLDCTDPADVNCSPVSP
jgi:hypothetical protein